MMACMIPIFFVKALTICSLNVRGMRLGWRNALVLDYLSTVSADIMCLQECGMDGSAGILEWRSAVAVWAPCCRSRAKWVGILIKNSNI